MLVQGETVAPFRVTGNRSRPIPLAKEGKWAGPGAADML